MRRFIVPIAALGLLSGCVTKAEHEKLQARVAELEATVRSLEAGGAKGGAKAGPSDAQETAAVELYKEIDALIGKADFKAAKTKLNELMTKYQGTKAASRAIRMKRELDVVGKKVENPEVERWFVGSDADLDFQHGATLVVFWEAWCPHCKREVPKLQKTYQDYKGKMKVVGLTKITKSATPEMVETFIEEKGVSYPIAKETGAASQEFAVSGIPAAAIVKDGEVVWRGHPGKLNNDLIDKLIAG